MAVVVLDVEVQDANKLPAPCDQEVVQALLAHSADPALGEGVGVRSLDRCVDDLCRNTVSTVRKSQARMPAAWRRRNDRHVVDPAARHGAGWRPLARRTLAMELAEAQQLPADALVAPAGVLGGQPHD
jgi:hypothetical protein